MSDKDNFKMRSKGNGVYDDVEYKYQYSSGSQYSPATLKITIECAAEGSLKLAKQTAFDVFWEKMGLSREIKTGDKEFDDLFYITTDDDNFTAAYLGSKEKREAATEIFNSGFREITLKRKFIEAKQVKPKKKKEITESMIEGIVKQLIILSKDIPDVVPEVNVETGWKTKRAAAFIIPTLLGLTGVVAMIAGLMKFEPLDTGFLLLDSLKYSVPAQAVFLWQTIWMIKGRSSSHHEFTAIFFISLFSFFLAGFGGELFLNGYLDESISTSYSTIVVSKKTETNKNNTDYKVKVESWREGKEYEKIETSKKIYESVNPHESTLNIRTKPGRFGYEWIVDYYINE
ncbi:MAG: hypothetical protein P9L92_14400 [Candidatus Electryonea clarkiae]|nr:hypothetical protein [Candidatus Electryonea clarkiae]MDP8286780.1 hypothetical protein [Candidatus Electryonea clarkiae]